MPSLIRADISGSVMLSHWWHHLHVCCSTNQAYSGSDTHWAVRKDTLHCT